MRKTQWSMSAPRVGPKVEEIIPGEPRQIRTILTSPFQEDITVFVIRTRSAASAENGVKQIASGNFGLPFREKPEAIQPHSALLVPHMTQRTCRKMTCRPTDGGIRCILRQCGYRKIFKRKPYPIGRDAQFCRSPPFRLAILRRGRVLPACVAEN